MIILSRETKCLLFGDGSKATSGKQHRLIAWGNHVRVTLFKYIYLYIYKFYAIYIIYIIYDIHYIWLYDNMIYKYIFYIIYI